MGSTDQVEWPITDEEDDSFEKIDPCSILPATDDEEDRIRTLATELAKARLLLRREETESRAWKDEVRNVHTFWICLIAVSFAAVVFALYRSSSLPSSPTPAPAPCPAPVPCSIPTTTQCPELPKDADARAVSFWHQADYNYDFRMLGGFVSEISGKSEKAGLKIGDEILAVNGVDVRDRAAEVIYNLIWKTDIPSGNEESRWARHDWEKPLTLEVKRNLVGFERLQVAVAKAGTNKEDQIFSSFVHHVSKHKDRFVVGALLVCLGVCVFFFVSFLKMAFDPRESQKVREYELAKASLLLGMGAVQSHETETEDDTQDEDEDEEGDEGEESEDDEETEAAQEEPQIIEEERTEPEISIPRSDMPKREFGGLQKTLDEYFP